MKSVIILFIVTSHANMGSNSQPTGLWLEELATPYYLFKSEGYEIEIISIAGGDVPIDPRSLDEEGQPESVKRFLADSQAINMVQSTLSVKDFDASKYAAVFLPGGHGTMWDFAENEDLSRIVSETLENGRIMAAICHGPAGLISAKDKDGKPLVKGRKITAFTNSEEEYLRLTEEMPFLLETRLQDLGAKILSAPNFQAYAVDDGNLITGQNPASSEVITQLIIQKLNKQYN